MHQAAFQEDAKVVPLSEALRYAECCRIQGRLVEAEAVCRRVLETEPNAAFAEHLLGLIAHQNGKLSDAIEHVQRAVANAPQVALFHANLGEMLWLAGRPNRAAEEARRALEIEPTMLTALSNLGVALYELTDFEGAIRAQRKAIEVKPDFVEAHSNLGQDRPIQHHDCTSAVPLTASTETVIRRVGKRQKEKSPGIRAGLRRQLAEQRLGLFQIEPRRLIAARSQ
jgi:tetratricopeptide (TPR) repeat protein